MGNYPTRADDPTSRTWAYREIDRLRAEVSRLTLAVSPVPEGDTLTELRRAIKRLRVFARDTPGGCRLLSEGPACVCPLCDIDRLDAALRRAAPAVALVEGDLCPRCEPSRMLGDGLHVVCTACGYEAPNAKRAAPAVGEEQ